jgi:hypothetical protein
LVVAFHTLVLLFLESTFFLGTVLSSFFVSELPGV